MVSFTRERGNQEPKEIAYDKEEYTKYLERYFNIEMELTTLREDKKELKAEFKGRVDVKLVTHLIAVIKREAKLNASESTKEDISNIIKDKIGSLID